MHGVPVLADPRGHRGLGEIHHGITNPRGDLLLGMSEGGCTSVGTTPATRMITLSTVQASTGTGSGSMLVGGRGVRAVDMSGAPWYVSGDRREFDRRWRVGAGTGGHPGAAGRRGPRPGCLAARTLISWPWERTGRGVPDQAGW
jgi:hypothetical protein